MNQNLKTRIVSGSIAGIVFLTVISYRSGFILMLLLLGLVGLYEMVQILRKAKLPTPLIALAILSNIWAIMRAGIYAFNPDQGMLRIEAFAGLLSALYLFTGAYVLYRKRLKSKWEFSLATLAWPGWSFALILLFITDKGQHHFRMFLGILLLVWASDIAQYFSGKNFGKKPLAKAISPKKTLEGWYGGILGTSVIAVVNSYWTWPELELQIWLMIGGAIWLMGTAGDLYESVLKRSVSIKDSGSILPGHGGILDRFDSLIFAFPFIVLILKYFAP